jgi:hypothetical protein
MKTHLGEKTLQINKWFLINTRTIVYADKRMEFMLSGTKQGKPSRDLRISPEFPPSVTSGQIVILIEMYITKEKKNNIGDAYVMMNIRTPERTVE